MKKSLVLTLLCATLASPVAFSELAPVEPASAFHLGVYDFSSQVPVASKKLEISHSSKKQQLCWNVAGVFNSSVQVTEIFTSPSAANFAIPPSVGVATSSADKLMHTIVGSRGSVNNGTLVVSCWRFEEGDPLGQYTLKVKVNQKTYGPVSFRVVK